MSLALIHQAKMREEMRASRQGGSHTTRNSVRDAESGAR
jgi:hypothetical protein